LLVGAVVALVLVACALSACGSSSSQSETTQTSGGTGNASGHPTNAKVDKEEFIAQANKVCEEAELRRGQALEEVLGGKPGHPLGQKYREHLVAAVALPVYAEMVDELKELEVPPTQQSKVNAIFSAMEATIKQVEADPSSGQTGGGATSKPDRMAYEYGITRCVI
jgi:hypothetical protein